MSKALFVHQVAENFRQYLEHNRAVTISEVAERIGYSETAIQKFRAGVRLSFPVAVALVRAYAPVRRQVVCPTCGRYYPLRKRPQV